jgi:hypothetical protein
MGIHEQGNLPGVRRRRRVVDLSPPDGFNPDVLDEQFFEASGEDPLALIENVMQDRATTGGPRVGRTKADRLVSESEGDSVRNQIALLLSAMAAAGLIGGAGLGWSTARAAGGTVPNALRAAAHNAVRPGLSSPKAGVYEGRGYDPPPGYRPWSTYNRHLSTKYTPENVAASEATFQRQIEALAMKLRSGRGPGYRPATPGQSSLQTPAGQTPRPASPEALWQSRPPPPGMSSWDWYREQAARSLRP